MRRLHPDNLRAAWWALRAAEGIKRRLATQGLEAALAVPPPPPLPDEAARGMRAVLRRRRETCVVEAIVRQAWAAAHGRNRDLVIGVTGARDFEAHAWLDGDPLPPPGVSPDLDPVALGLSVSPGAVGEARGAEAPAALDGRRFHVLLRRPPGTIRPGA